MLSEKIEKLKNVEENGNCNPKYEKDQAEEKEVEESNLTNIKVFNGLIEEEKNVFKKLNQNNKNLNTNSNNNSNSNKNNKNDIDIYFNDNKLLDLNYISFGDCDNIFVNNINKKNNKEDRNYKNDSKNKVKKDKKDKRSTHSKSKNKKNKHSNSKNHFSNKNNNLKNVKINKKYVEEMLTNDSNKRPKTMSFNDPSENDYINKNSYNKEIIEKKEKECKNFFKISSINNGMALLVSGDDTVFTFPAYLLPKGAKLGESFTLEIKLFNNNYNKKVMEELENIQNKYI